MARRKVKNGEKSPWGQCLTIPVPNGRRRSDFWLFSGTNQNSERRRPFGTGLAGKTLSPGALLTVLYFSSCHIFPPVYTFPRFHYLPLGHRGCPQRELFVFLCLERSAILDSNQPDDDRSSWRDSLELKVWNINQPLSPNSSVVDLDRERESGLVSKESVVLRTESVCEWNWIYHMKGFK